MENHQSRFMTKFTLLQILIIPIAIAPLYSLDSFNVPKVTFLVTYGCIALTFSLFNFRKLMPKVNYKIKIIAILFLISLLIAFLSSSTPWEQQFYGRENRNIGLIVFISLIMIMIFFSLINFAYYSFLIIKYISISSFIIIGYSIIQILGFDPFNWNTINLKIFSTLGNPNFLSAFLACSLVPVLIFSQSIINIKAKKFKGFLLFILFSVYLYVMFVSRSYQGLIISYITILSFFVFRSHLAQKRNLSILGLTLLLCGTILGLLGTINLGPFSSVLYKSSVVSRGDFFRAALKMGNENWVHGIGIDGFGDYYLSYRDAIAGARVNAEYVDSSHNYLLDIYSNLGLFALVLYSLLIFLTFRGFIKLIKVGQKDRIYLSLFVFWLGVQIQSLISPTNYVFLVYNFAFAGLVLSNLNTDDATVDSVLETSKNRKFYSAALGLLIAIAILMPFVMKDRNLLIAQKGNSLDAVLIASNNFPKSIVTYNRILTILAQTGSHPKVMLNLAQDAVRFNERTVPGQFTILTSDFSTKKEKIRAYQILRTLDPHNPIIKEFQPK